jgi:uncharacterized membrane protein
MPETRFKILRTAFITGMVLVAPLVVTIWALKVIIGIVGGSITPLFAPYLPSALGQLPSIIWDILITVIVLALVTLLGFLSHLFLGQFLGALGERLIQGIPGIGGFYNSVKQFIETFGAKDRAQFSKVVLVQFPRPGVYTLGFLTNKAQGEPHGHFGEVHWTIFVPTSPSPVNGFFLFLPRTEIIELNMSVTDAMKTVISCGAVLPVWPDPTAAQASIGVR